MAGSSAAGQMRGSQERSDSGADDKPPGGVGLEDGGQMGLDLLPAERADGMVIKGAEELVELLMVGPAEMVLGRDLEYRTVRDTVIHMLRGTVLQLKLGVGEPTRSIQWAVGELAQNTSLADHKVRCLEWGRPMKVKEAITAAVRAVPTWAQVGHGGNGYRPGEAVRPEATEAREGLQQAITREKIESEQWSLTKLTYFLSSSDKNSDLSSFETKYGFLGGAGGEVPTELHGTTLETWFIGKWFRSRENFFQAMKAAFAATGTHTAANEALAASMLIMTPRETKQAGKLPNKKNPSWGGQLVGLNALRWDALRAAVMDLAVRQQAAGCAAFAERLLLTSDAWLAEATSDTYWGIGMNEAEAARVPPQNRRMTFGKNHHGVALMLERSRLRAARGDG